MFRALRRKKNAISEADAKALLAAGKRGVLAMNGDGGYPYAIPVDYLYDEAEGKIFFHGAKAGHKADSIRRDDRVCFTVYGDERYTEDDWAPLLRSAVVFGRCEMIGDRDITRKRLEQLALKYYPSAEEAEAELAKGLGAVQLYQITIEHLSGKQIREK